MRIFPFIRVSGLLLGLASGALVSVAGCDAAPESGTQAKVDQKVQQDQQDKMREFMQKKQGGAPKPAAK